MTREDIARLLDRRRAAMARLDADALTAFHAVEGVLESPTARGTVTGRDAIARIYREWFAGFPDLALDWADALVDGNRVVDTVTVSGTDTGGFLGLPPTGKHFSLPIVFILTLDENGLIAHERRIYDFTGMLVQIGVLKAKPA